MYYSCSAVHVSLNVSAHGKYLIHLTLDAVHMLTHIKWLSQLKFRAQHLNKQVSVDPPINLTGNQVHIFGLFENYHTSCAFVATDHHPTIQHIGCWTGILGTDDLCIVQTTVV